MHDEDREAILRYEKSLDCIQCGLCLSQCPTYEQTGNEAASPRGRIRMMRALAEDRLELSQGFAEQMNLCLVCRACESVCPSAVQFSRMMEITRQEIREHTSTSRLSRWTRDLLLRRILPSKKLLGMLIATTQAYQRTGLQGFLRRTRLNKLLPKTLQRMEFLLPRIPARTKRQPLASFYPAHGKRRGRVALLEGCVMGHLFGDINRRTVNALTTQGFEVVVPRSQSCCGALHLHAGDVEFARQLARRNIESFQAIEGLDYLVMNAAGCGAAIKELPLLFDAQDPEFRTAKALAEKTIDILELFDKLDLNPRGPAEGPLKICYDAPCHLQHAQKITDPATRVLARVPKVEWLPLARSESCCGAAGIYNVQQPDMSDRIISDKINDLRRTGAQVLVTGNPGCMLQWQRGIEQAGLAVRVQHPVELL